MQIARDLLTVADFDAALIDEAGASRPLVPSDAPLESLWMHAGAGDWAYRRCTVEFAPIPGRVVSVRKQRHGVRPVAELSVRDRVLYRALVNRWKGALVAPDRSNDAYQAFVSAPLKLATKPGYVVASDVTAYYQYVDHGLLARELLARTGDSAGVDALIQLLAGLVGRSYGLPQQSGPSDVLADVYLSVVERRLIRQGLMIWRYNDDFRIGVNSWRDALNAVDSLERECRQMGLALNDAKTVIRRRKTYKTATGRRDKALEALSRQVEMDLTDLSLSYEGNLVVTVPEQGDVATAAARRILADWHALARRANRLSRDEQDTMSVLSDLVRWALPVLRKEPTDGKILRACGRLLRIEQTLTPSVCQYLKGCGDDPALAIEWFEKFLSKDPYLTPWQAWWVAPSLREVAGSYSPGSNQRAWLEDMWNNNSSSEPVIAGLALTMAEKRLVPVDDLVRIFDGMTEIGRPSLARAIGSIAPTNHAGAATLSKEDEWVRWAFEVGQP